MCAKLSITVMDDYEIERVGSDNPAQSLPAAQLVLPGRQRSNGNIKPTAKQSEESQKTEVEDTSLTKYDVCFVPNSWQTYLLTIRRLGGVE